MQKSVSLKFIGEAPAPRPKRCCQALRLPTRCHCKKATDAGSMVGRLSNLSVPVGRVLVMPQARPPELVGKQLWYTATCRN